MRLTGPVRYLVWSGVLTLIFYPTLRWLGISWLESAYYGHAIWVLVSAVVIGVIQIKRATHVPSRSTLSWGWGIAGVILAAMGYWTGLNALKAWGLILFLWWGALLFLEQKTRSGLRTILVLTACIVPIPFLGVVLSFLQRTAVYGSVCLLGITGNSAEATGSLVHFSSGQEIIIGESCSGLQSLLVLISITLLGTYLFPCRSSRRWLLVGLSLPVAWLSNLLRLFVVLSIGAGRGADVALAFWDTMAGYLFYSFSLLAMGGLAVLLTRFRASVALTLWIIILLLGSPGKILGENGTKYHTNATDTNPYFFTSHEGRWRTRTDLFLDNNIAQLPRQLGQWKGDDVPIADPLPVFLRLYQHQETGHNLFLQPVFGRDETAFHTAEVCYINAGWKMRKRGYKILQINGHPLPVRFATAESDGHKHMIFYWYVWPNSKRVISDGSIMLRISMEVAEGDDIPTEQAAVNFIETLSRAEFGSVSPPLAQLPPPDLTDWKNALEKAQVTKYQLASDLQDMRRKSVRWLSEQIVPNAIVRRPSYDRRNLILSYRSDPASSAYRYVFSKSALYDNALAVIAFTMVGELDQAASILDSVESVMSQDGDLYFTFNTHNTWPNQLDSYGAVVRTGASAWMGYAITYYLAHQILNDSDFFVKNRDAVRLLRFAERLGERLLVRQVTDPDDLRRGLLTGGKGRYVLRLHDNDITEEFEAGEVRWCSVEHNIDSYFFFRDLGRLTRDTRWTTAASQVKEALLRAAWNSQRGQFHRGVNILERDPAPALDCASWGAIVLTAWGEKQKSRQAISALEDYHSVDKGVSGFKPYSEGPIYESTQAQKYFFPQKKEGLWENFAMVWPEGSLGVGVALARTGHRKDAEKVLREMTRLQDIEGGMDYATQEIRFQFSTSPSVASTAWAVILASTLDDPLSDVLFWGP